MVYKLNDKEAKEMIQSGRGKLWDNATHSKVETPQEWLDLVEKEEQKEEKNYNWEYVCKFKISPPK
jgi:hypothetical protein